MDEYLRKAKRRQFPGTSSGPIPAGARAMANMSLVGALLVGGWTLAQPASAADTGPYVRLEGGFSQANNAQFRDNEPNSPDCFLMASGASPRCNGELNHLGSGWTLGGGIGYRFSGGIRVDLSYNHRAGYKLKGSDPAGTDFDPDVKSDTSMINGTYDLPLLMGSVKPFIGAGIGRSRNEMKSLKWNDPGCCNGTLTGGKTSDTAWQLTLGAEIVFDKGEKTFEFLFRHADLGRFVKDAGPDQAAPAGTFNASGITGPATGKLRSNEIVFAIRRNF
jgi:opacity protein-like surface antigen